MLRTRISSREGSSQRVLADLRLHFVKSKGQSRPKTFKLRAFELAPKQTVAFRTTISLAQHTTRKHYPGTHLVELLLNGKARRHGSFDITNR